jgi:hypothetical protein
MTNEELGTLVLESGAITNPIQIGGPFASVEAAVTRSKWLTKRSPVEHFVIHVPENRATKEYWIVSR